jgi:hypothetical protein
MLRHPDGGRMTALRVADYRAMAWDEGIICRGKLDPVILEQEMGFLLFESAGLVSCQQVVEDLS